MMSTSVAANGEVTQSLNFSVNSEKIKKKSQNNSEYLTFIANLVENIKTIRDNFLFTIALKYMQNPNEKYKINDGVVISNVLYLTQSDSVGFVIKYYSLDCWNYYHEPNNNQEVNNESKNIFIKKTVSKSQFVFSNNMDDEMMVGKKYKDLYLSSAKGLSFENDLNDYSPDFVYSYSTPYKKLHSNADMQFSNNELYYHIWKVNDGELGKEKEISVWQNEINYGMWYLFALIIVLLPTGLILTVYGLKKRGCIKRRAD